MPRCEFPGCDRKFVDKKLLQSHRTIHPKSDSNIQESTQEGAPGVCPYCGIDFGGKYNLKQHIKAQHKACEKIRKNEVEKIKRRKKQVICPVCGLGFRQDGFKRHFLAVHDHSQKWQCDHCPKIAHTKGAITAHVRLHIKTEFRKVHRCDICEKFYVSADCLRSHQLDKHVVQDQEFICPVCSKSFKLSKHLKVHIRDMHEGRQFNCDNCSKSYSRKRDLLLHVRARHNDNSRNLCSICGKKFLTSKYLA